MISSTQVLKLARVTFKIGHMTGCLGTKVPVGHMTAGLDTGLGHMTADPGMRLCHMTAGLGMRLGHMTTVYSLCWCVGVGAGDAGVCACVAVPRRGQCLLPGRDQPAHHLRHLREQDQCEEIV